METKETTNDLEKLNQQAVEAANSLKSHGAELRELYEELARQEDLELIIEEGNFPEVEFRMSLSSGLILELCDARKQMAGPDESLSLNAVLGKVLEDWRDLASP